MDRDMSYDLDGAFSGRNAGEMVSARQTRTVVRRKPGLTVETPSDDPEALDTGTSRSIVDYDAAINLDPALATPLREFSPFPDPQMAGLGMEISLPMVGRVNLLHLAAGVAAGVAVAMLLRRRPATNPRRRR